MIPIIMLLVLLLVCARLAMGKAETPSAMGWLLIAMGAAVFAIRLQHEGPYAPPEEGNLRAAILALVVGVGLRRRWRVRDGTGKWVIRAALAFSPIILFFATYSTLAEFEEVVVLRATQPSGETNDLRLWIVDFDDSAWVIMPAAKADANNLLNTRAELQRNGRFRCVGTTRHTDLETGNRASKERNLKYAVGRLATQSGLFSETAQQGMVALELRPCNNG